MTPLLVVRNLCSAVTQSGYFKISCLKKVIESFEIFPQGQPFIECQKAPWKKHTRYFFVFYFEDSNLISTEANFNYYLHVTFWERIRDFNLADISKCRVSFHMKNASFD